LRGAAALLIALYDLVIFLPLAIERIALMLRRRPAEPPALGPAA
jgi:hypothetical protein